MDQISNEHPGYITLTAQMGRFGKKSCCKTEMVWTCTEERLDGHGYTVYWEKDADGTAWTHATGKACSG